MGLFPERKVAERDYGIAERPTDLEISPELKKETGIEVISTTPEIIPVRDNQEKPIIQSSENREIVVELPDSPENLSLEAKGPIEESRVWRAIFYLRQSLIAFVNGWKTIVSNNKTGSGTANSSTGNAIAGSSDPKSD